MWEELIFPPGTVGDGRGKPEAPRGGGELRYRGPAAVPNDVVTTVYLDGMEVRSVAGAPATGTRYYGNAAMRTTTGTAADQGLWWLVNSHQNSATMAIDADTAGAPVRRQRYLPYGEHRAASDSLPTDRGFLNKPEEADGLVHLGARHYDPAVGRFLAVDPVVDPNNPKSLNPYAYAHNNPASLTDPSGLAPACEEKGKACQEQQLAYQGTQVAAEATMREIRGTQAYEDLAIEAAMLFEASTRQSCAGSGCTGFAKAHYDLVSQAEQKRLNGESLNDLEAYASWSYHDLHGIVWSDPTQDRAIHWLGYAASAVSAFGLIRAIVAKTVTSAAAGATAGHLSAHAVLAAPGGHAAALCTWRVTPPGSPPTWASRGRGVPGSWLMRRLDASSVRTSRVCPMSRRAVPSRY